MNLSNMKTSLFRTNYSKFFTVCIYLTLLHYSKQNSKTIIQNKKNPTFEQKQNMFIIFAEN